MVLTRGCQPYSAYPLRCLPVHAWHRRNWLTGAKCFCVTCSSSSADATATEQLKPLHIRHPSAGVVVLRLTALEYGLHRAMPGMKKKKGKKKAQYRLYLLEESVSSV
jgi:hypothetical protein